MTDIGPGDWVERIKPGRSWTGWRVGAIYRVRQLEGPHNWACDDCGAREGLLFFDAPDPHRVILGATPYDSWCACAFRPVYRPKASVIEAMKRPALEDA